MGYRGKVAERERARELRAEGWALLDIAQQLGVAKSSVSVWVRDVAFEPRPRRRVARVREPNALQRRKQAEIEAMDARGRERLSVLDEQAFLSAGAALYAGEGTKRGGCVSFANSDPEMIRFFCGWLRHFFEIDEARLRLALYLHQGLDLDEAVRYWSEVTQIPGTQLIKPYRAAADPAIKTAKHVHGCCHVRYSCTRTHREVMGLIRALLSSATLFPG